MPKYNCQKITIFLVLASLLLGSSHLTANKTKISINNKSGYTLDGWIHFEGMKIAQYFYLNSKDKTTLLAGINEDFGQKFEHIKQFDIRIYQMTKMLNYMNKIKNQSSGTYNSSWKQVEKNWFKKIFLKVVFYEKDDDTWQLELDTKTEWF